LLKLNIKKKKKKKKKTMNYQLQEHLEARQFEHLPFPWVKMLIYP
jgi:hypothetical protein